MAKKKASVWQLLASLGHHGDREVIIRHVFAATSRVTLRLGGRAVEGGDFLDEVYDSLATTDWLGGWIRLREAALRRILARLAREGLLDVIAIGDDGADADDMPDAEGIDGRGDGTIAAPDAP